MGNLALRRRAGDVIYLYTKSGKLELAVVEIAGKEVLFSIDAPQDVKVVRKELLDPNRKTPRSEK